MQMPVGVTTIAVTAVDGSTSSTCSVQVTVQEARVSISPAVVEIASLSTAHGQATLLIDNEGDLAVSIFGITFADNWVTIASVRDLANMFVEFPTTLAAGSSVLVTLRGEGTAIATNGTVTAVETNATVLSTAGDTLFPVHFEVTRVS